MTHTQAEALRRVMRAGPGAWDSTRSRAGGAVSRMFDRMVEKGWCTKPPHNITEAGIEALRRYDRDLTCRN